MPHLFYYIKSNKINRIPESDVFQTDITFRYHKKKRATHIAWIVPKHPNFHITFYQKKIMELFDGLIYSIILK